MPCRGVPLRLTKGVSTWPMAATWRVRKDCVGMRSLCLLRLRNAAGAARSSSSLFLAELLLALVACAGARRRRMRRALLLRAARAAGLPLLDI